MTAARAEAADVETEVDMSHPQHDHHEAGHDSRPDSGPDSRPDSGPEDGHGPVVEFSAEFWDERYAASERIWSGQPNRRLVEQVADLTPGSALEVGSGEGADAIWLAERGWEVTGVDISTVALEKSAAHVRQTAPEVADRLTWQQADLLTWEPPVAAYDLVTSHFMHLPGPLLAALHGRLAAAVRPGGTLLVVGHDPSDLEVLPRRRHGSPDMLPSPQQVTAALDPAQWDVQVAEAQPREVADPDDPEGGLVTIHDAVVRARRLPS